MYTDSALTGIHTVKFTGIHTVSFYRYIHSAPTGIHTVKIYRYKHSENLQVYPQ